MKTIKNMLYEKKAQRIAQGDVALTFDDDRQALEDRGEGPDGGGKAKGGLFTRRGGLYNKPARKK